MLKLANENLSHINCPRHFICADIMTKNFKEEILRITKNFDRRILSFLGCTFVNHNQTQITDTLYNMLEKNDYLRFEVFARPDTTQQSDYKIFKRYEGILKNQKMLDFFFYSMHSLGVKLEDGELKMRTKKEESVGALLINFYFKLKKDVKIVFRHETIHLRATQEI
jgi:hypothetical protein